MDEPVVKDQSLWDGWRAECLSCGWVGSFFALMSAAQREADDHVCRGR